MAEPGDNIYLASKENAQSSISQFASDCLVYKIQFHLFSSVQLYQSRNSRESEHITRKNRIQTLKLALFLIA